MERLRKKPGAFLGALGGDSESTVVEPASDLEERLKIEAMRRMTS